MYIWHLERHQSYRKRFYYREETMVELVLEQEAVVLLMLEQEAMVKLKKSAQHVMCIVLLVITKFG